MEALTVESTRPTFAWLSLLAASVAFLLIAGSIFIQWALVMWRVSSQRNGIGSEAGAAPLLDVAFVAADGIVVGGIVVGVLSLVRREPQWPWALAGIGLNLLAPVAAIVLVRLVLG